MQTDVLHACKTIQWLFVLFQLLMVIVYGISFARLAGLDAPVSQVNAILRVLAQSSRTRYEAARLAFASSPEERQEFRVCGFASTSASQS
jgi:hypothetical protein